MPGRKRKRPRGIVDTSVLVAGIAGFKALDVEPRNSSARFLRDWIEEDTFTWLISEEIILEYKQVLAWLGVRRSAIGKLINLILDEAELVPIYALPNISPDPGDDPFCACAETGHADFIVTLNLRDFPQRFLSAHVITPGESIPTTARRKRTRQSRQ